MAGHVRVGTSGWIYKHWRGFVYPPELPSTLSDILIAPPIVGA